MAQMQQQMAVQQQMAAGQQNAPVPSDDGNGENAA
jgi:hypothetical protein